MVDPRLQRTFVAGFLILLVRGILLWVVLPLTWISWVFLWPTMRRRKVSLDNLVGWADLNLVAGIEHTVLRPLVATPRPWTPAAELPDVQHRVKIFDLA